MYPVGPAVRAERIATLTAALLLHGVVLGHIARPSPDAEAFRPAARDVTRWEIWQPMPAPERAEASSANTRSGRLSLPAPAAPIVNTDIPAIPPEVEGFLVTAGTTRLGRSALQQLAGGLPEATAPVPIIEPTGRSADPPVLLAAPGLEGSYHRGRGTADLEYVVNADGTVDGATIRVLFATDSTIARLARVSLVTARFRPGRFGDVPVAVRVRQRVTFREG